MQGRIVPPHVLRALERFGEPEVRDGARRALVEMRALRARAVPRTNGVSRRASAVHVHPEGRRVFSCGGTETRIEYFEQYN